MSDDTDGTTRIDRRTYLAAVGGVGAAALAGCSGGGGDGGDGGSAPEEVSNYLSNTGNFDGSVEDMTGSDEVTVKVGASGNGNNWAFDPAAVRVSTGTTVVWEWTGEGGSHNVVAESGDWESKLVGTEGHTFEQTFESPGTIEYFCRPHKGSGMKGVVVVGEESESGGDDSGGDGDS